ncbi:hypothetical protein, conserved [Babesia bigemina]|uniref:Uncharacterized protein n=1 Tax=Babesia bigemina TaxID=5866 RepID=A0A061BTF5_BABBI|nr:hypothetical protein, conserved [Babesia bigemina]CDR71789.1 hypothetical protein, conserved [Babesia bigemina]|eukprot:XP_012770733.1 hypothetical protein, conserved [Babesia bigemina]
MKNKNIQMNAYNLVPGLEKFLGFNKDPKGYEGSGIVYSDLDRLCDGVMGFLSGVLGAVKDENEVTTYDNYITPDDNKLQKVLEEVNNNIGSGRTGLAASVGAVKGWLEGYEGEMKTRTKTVTGPLDTTIRDIYQSAEYIKTLRSQEYDAVSDKLADWADSVNSLVTQPKSSLDSLRDLDPNLKNKLETNVCVIFNSVNTFVESTKLDYSDLVAVASSVDRDLTTLESQISSTVTEQVRVLKETVTKGIDGLRMLVKEELERKVKLLTDTVWKLHTVRQNIKKSVDVINGKFDEKDTSPNTALGAASLAQNIVTNAATLRDDDLGSLWAEIQLALTGLTDGIADKEGNQGHLNDIVTSVGEYATNFEETFKQSINDAVTAIVDGEPVKQYLYSYVSGNNHAKKFKGRFTAADNDAILKVFLSIVQKNIKAALTAIKANPKPGSQSTVDGHLQNVHKYLSNYAEQVIHKVADVVGKIQSDLQDGYDLQMTDVSESGYNPYLKWGVEAALTELQSLAKGAEIEIQRFKSEINMGKLTAAIDGVKALGEELKKLVEKPLIEKIQTKLNNDVSMPAEKIKQGLAYVIDSVNMELRNISAILEDKKDKNDKHDKKLVGVKNQIDEKTNELNQQVTSTLDAQVRTLKEGTLEKATNLCQSTITSKVTSDSATAKRSIKQEALRMFADTKEKELEALKGLVTQKYTEIGEIIQQDLESGLKGMMGKMKANDTYLDTLQKQTEIRTATTQVRMYLEELLQYVEDQVKISTAQQTKKDTVASTKIANVKTMLGLSLDDLSSSNHFDHTFSRNLADFTNTLSALQGELESSVILGETLRNVFSRVYHRKEIFPMSLGGVLKAKSAELKRQHREAKGGHTGALDRRTRYQWRAHKKCS